MVPSWVCGRPRGGPGGLALGDGSPGGAAGVGGGGGRAAAGEGREEDDEHHRDDRARDDRHQEAQRVPRERDHDDAAVRDVLG
jgi:hypothetical protein